MYKKMYWYFIFGSIISVNLSYATVWLLAVQNFHVNNIRNHKMTKYISKDILQTKFVALLWKRCGRIKDNIIFMF